MKNLKNLFAVLCIALIAVCSYATVLGQNKVANMTAGASSVKWDVSTSNAGLIVTISAPDGEVYRKESRYGSVEIKLVDDKGERLPDGQYAYELRVVPVISAATRETLSKARAKGNDAEVGRDLRKRGELPAALVESGSFSILNGSVVLPGSMEEPTSKRVAQVTTPARPFRATTFRPARETVMSAVQRHHPVLNPFFDFVIADDLIVQGSACVGLDCVDGESFGFDTIRVKENNDRIQFDDTSSSAGFASNNWQIRANSSASGGGNFLAFVDQGTTGNSETGTIVFEVDAGAPANSLRVSSGGNIGVGTATPVLDIHVNTTDTPAMRLEQNNSGGFTAQTWDIGANEANFFVRDVTSGSRLPFRIRPGAPTSSIDIAANGFVGVGTASPSLVGGSSSQIIEISGSSNPGLAIRNTTGSRQYLMYVGSTGNNLLNIFDATAGADRITVNTTGQVGIGTTAPTDLLSVNGTASKPGGGSWLNFSDERLKNIKGRFNTGLNAVMQLQPIRYEYKSNNALGLKSEGEHVGFGAQSLQKVIPEAVSSTESGYLTVNNDPIIWTMLNAIKEQQKEIEQLKTEVRRLRATARRRK